MTDATLSLPALDHDHEALARQVARDINVVHFINAELICERDQRDPAGRLYFQIECHRPDTFTGEMGVGRGGKAYLSPAMIEDEMVRLAMGLLLAYTEHEAREAFEYKGVKVFGPHIAIDALLVAGTQLKFRPTTQES